MLCGEKRAACSVPKRYSSIRSGLTLVELFVILAIIGILVAMVLPGIGRNSGGAARRAMCMNNIRQIALASHNYESANLHFPQAVGPVHDDESYVGSSKISGLALLLPYMEEVDTWDVIIRSNTFGNVVFPAGPDPWAAGYPPWEKQISHFQCPQAPESHTGYGKTNYAFCIGDRAQGIHNPQNHRGAFGGSLKITFGDITDGSSNTIALVEIGSDYRRNVNGNFAVNQPGVLNDPSSCRGLCESKGQRYLPEIKLGSPRRGGRWADGTAGCGIVNTILPPNSPSASVAGHGSDGIYSAGSDHPSGVVIALMDGSGHFISDDIDSGDSNRRTLTPEEMENGDETPFGVWGKLGTANGGEIVGIHEL